MVDGDQQNVLEVGELDQACAEQRPDRDIKGKVRFYDGESIEFGLLRLTGEPANIDHGDANRHRPGNDLRQFAAFKVERGPQNLMAADNLVERPLQACDVQFPLEPKADGYVVRGISWTRLIQFPESGLRERGGEGVESVLHGIW